MDTGLPGVRISWPTAGYHVALRSSGGVSQLRGHLHVRQHAGVVLLELARPEGSQVRLVLMLIKA
jgi:hypothetical protein